LFVLLQRSGISHGDMKATNLITDGEHLALIDYDGARQHAQQKTLVRALAADKQRFLQNWANKPVLQKRLADLLNA
jgi:tRNA A-37 threonylcarbamoyl transferase component Bud32